MKKMLYFVHKTMWYQEDYKGDILFDGTIGVFFDEKSAIDFASKTIDEFVTDWNKLAKSMGKSLFYKSPIQEERQFVAFRSDDMSPVRISIYEKSVETDR